MKRVLLLFLSLAATAAPDESIADLHRAFQDPPDDSRIMMRWWWFGPAVTKPELEREMRLMKEGGIGGFAGPPRYPGAPHPPGPGVHNRPLPPDEVLAGPPLASSQWRETWL